MFVFRALFEVLSILDSPKKGGGIQIFIRKREGLVKYGWLFWKMGGSIT